jgi:hypothetical protein
MTEWRTHPLHSSIQVSNTGQLRRNGSDLSPTPCLNPKTHKLDSLVVGVLIDGAWRTRRVHRLVLETFVGFRQPGQVCCHKDGNPANNAVSNLRWDTQKANIDDAIEHGTFVRAPGFRNQRGEGNHQSKLNAETVLEIRRLASCGHTRKDIGEMYGLHPAYVSLVCTRKRWAHI